MNVLLSLHGLRKHFGTRLLFEIDTLTLLPGSAYVLTGLNGTGKSTLLRILAGLETADIEATEFLGDPVRLQPYPRLLREAIVYVHQHPVVFSGSLEKNIGYGLVARGRPRAEIARAVDEALHWAGLEHLRGIDPRVLSGGEKQRLALARARVLTPRLLLLDEPTANLDGMAREQVIALIREFASEGGSVVAACHDRDLIALPGMQRLKLRDGRLQARQNRVRLA